MGAFLTKWFKKWSLLKYVNESKPNGEVKNHHKKSWLVEKIDAKRVTQKETAEKNWTLLFAKSDVKQYIFLHEYYDKVGKYLEIWFFTIDIKFLLHSINLLQIAENCYNKQFSNQIK